MVRRPMQLIQLNRGLNLRQQRFFNLAISKVENGISEISSSDYKEIYSDETDHFYSTAVINDIEKLISLNIQTASEKKIRWDNVFLRVEYDIENCVYVFHWSPYMKERIENVREKYIQQDLKTLAKFTNKYSFIWYDYFKSNYRQWKWKLSKEEAFNLLQVANKKSYAEHHAMFFKQCIQASLKEINEHTEYQINVTPIKKGRAVVGYEFIRRTEKEVEISVTSKQIEVIKEILDRYGDTPLMMREIAKLGLFDSEVSKELTDLFFEIQSFKNFLASADTFTSEGFKDIVATAIKKDNRFKYLWDNVKQRMKERPTIDQFIEENQEQGSNNEISLYNWLEKRSD